MDTPDLDAMKESRLWQCYDEITYRCYRYNRRTYPNISPLAWESIFGSITADMEVRFWMEEFAENIATTGSVMQALRETN